MEDTDTVTIYLDSVKKWSNKNECRNVNRAWCLPPDGGNEPLEATGDGDNIRKVCFLLTNNCGFRGQVEVFRGNTLVFSSCPVKRWLKGLPRGEKPEWLL